MEELVFGWEKVRIEMIERQAEQLEDCPLCAQSSQRVQSWYQRSLQDLPCCGQVLRLRVAVRRFFCDNTACRRKVFAEQLPALMLPYARRTVRHNTALTTIGLAHGGEAGQRTAQQLGFRVSADTLLRRVRAIPAPPAREVRVLGMDDFALRRGQNYGTILVNEETHRPIDLLPDREAATLTRWLKKHPEVEIITRDRSRAYAEAAREGAPQAQQVADRFHLGLNLREAVERVLVKQSADLRKAAQAVSPRYQAEMMLREEGLLQELPTPLKRHVTKPVALQAERRAQRLARYEEVHRLFQAGLSKSAIARQTGLQRETVRKFLRAERFPERVIPAGRPSSVTPFAGYLRERWRAGCTSAKKLYQEIRARGFKGAPVTVRRYVSGWRKQAAPALRHLANLPDFPTPAPRQATWWLLGKAEGLEAPERNFVTELTRLAPALQTLQTLAQDFLEMLRNRVEPAFDGWYQRVEASGLRELKSFAEGLLTDETAVRAALASEWSNGQTEGQVNRLKMLKRQCTGVRNSTCCGCVFCMPLNTFSESAGEP
jgi:transposase